MSNVLRVIFPYQDRGQWMFDDESTGLVREPFVCGADSWVGQLAMAARVPPGDWGRGFRLIFSDQWMPDAHLVVRHVDDPSVPVGALYRDEAGIPGWLCPALLLYFPTPPAQIFARGEPLPAAA